MTRNMLRHLILALALIALTIQSSSKTDAFGYNRRPQISFISESHPANTYHPYLKTVTERPITAAPYQTEHKPRKYKTKYGGQAHYSRNTPRVQYMRQLNTPRKYRFSKPSIIQLHSFQRRRSYVPQIFQHKKRNMVKLMRSQNVKYKPTLSNKSISPQSQIPHGLITEKTIPYQPRYSSLRKQPFSLHGSRSKPVTNYSDNRFPKQSLKPSNFITEEFASNEPMYHSIPKRNPKPSFISHGARLMSVTNNHASNAVQKSTSESLPSSPLNSKSTADSLYQMVLDDNLPKHSDALAYDKKMPTGKDTVDNEHTQDAKSSKANKREYLSSIPGDVNSRYNPVWPYGSKDEVMSDHVNDKGVNADSMNKLNLAKEIPTKVKHHKIEAPTEKTIHEEHGIEKKYEMKQAKKIRMVRKKYRPELDHSLNMDWNCGMYAKNEIHDAEILMPYGC